MKAYFENLRWEKGQVRLFRRSEVSFIPSNAVEGSNDTLIVPVSAELNFTVVTENNDCITSNIIDVVKGVNGWKKLSQSRYDKLNNKLVNIQEYDIDSNGNIRNLASIVRV